MSAGNDIWGMVLALLAYAAGDFLLSFMAWREWRRSRLR